MPRKSNNSLKTVLSLSKLLKSRRNISSLIAAVLIILGLISPGARTKVAEVLNTVMPGIADTGGPMPSKKQGPIQEGIYTVMKVVDGDTLDISNDGASEHRIRLIGADTPETVKPNTPVQPFGMEASEFTKRKVAEAGYQVRIAFDGDPVDRYGRNLAMLYLQMPNGQEVWHNELLIREGLARAQLQYRFSKGAKSALQQAENEAKRERRNIWSTQ